MVFLTPTENCWVTGSYLKLFLSSTSHTEFLAIRKEKNKAPTQTQILSKIIRITIVRLLFLNMSILCTTSIKPTIVNCVIWVAGRKLVYHTIPVGTIAFYTGIEYSRGKIAIFPLPNDDLSEDQGLPRSWSCELVQKQWAKKLKNRAGSEVSIYI